MAMAALMDELIEEILRRLPPSEPGCLVHAALVCKRWCSIVSDAGFRRRFGEFHRAPPTLGVVYNAVDGDAYVASFRACASFPHRADRRGEAVLDCRHGHVLLRCMPPVGEDLNLPSASAAIHVWDPATNEQWQVPLPYLYPYKFSDVVVLCAATASGTCDHLDCHGGPFLVVIVGTDLKDMFVYTYSSETAAWSEPSSIHLDAALNSHSMLRPGLVIGDAIYFMHGEQHMILKYDLGGHVISMIDPPFSLHAQGKVSLVATKDGGLGVAYVKGCNLHLWSWRAAGSNGVKRWVNEQVIKLHLAASDTTGGPSTDELDVVGFGEGTDIIFGTAKDSIFVVWQNTGRVMKECGRTAMPFRSHKSMFCYQNFYTPALGAFLEGDETEASVSSA
nr:uncharacterized protein LOC117842793 [Setaria viridis]